MTKKQGLHKKKLQKKLSLIFVAFIAKILNLVKIFFGKIDKVRKASIRMPTSETRKSVRVGNGQDRHLRWGRNLGFVVIVVNLKQRLFLAEIMPQLRNLATYAAKEMQHNGIISTYCVAVHRGTETCTVL